MQPAVPPVVRKLARQPSLLAQFRELDAQLSAAEAGLGDRSKVQEGFDAVAQQAKQIIGRTPKPAEFAQAQLLESAIEVSGLVAAAKRHRTHP